MASDFELKPLSSGLGLGTLRASKPKKQSVSNEFAARREVIPAPVSLPKIPNAIEINPSLESVKSQPVSAVQRPAVVQRQAAKAAYQPHSEAQSLRAKRQTRFFMWFIRACLGWGLDVFVATLTLIVSLVLGTLAWRIGSGSSDGADPFAAVAHVINMALLVGPVGIFTAFVAMFFIYWSLMRVVIGSTIGGALRQ